MKIRTHTISKTKIAEILSDVPVISTPEEGLDLLGNLFFQNIDSVILYEKNISPHFYRMESGLAEAIKEKFCNYRFQMVIVGRFEKVKCKKFKTFMVNSKDSDRIFFAGSFKEALAILKNQINGGVGTCK